METAHDKLDSIVHSDDVDDRADRERQVPDRTPDRAPVESGSGLRIERRERSAPELDTTRETPLWERDDAPKGSTESSELVYKDGVPVRVSGPTHFGHLANGNIVGTFGIGTHHDDGDGPVPFVAHYAG